ncbi:MAG: thioredoxin-disulfide reductase [Holosporales bacterium]|jgi:thioredoxin reductase (NADPH)|nr:thioredoxin-disulfide reductase [Holosporales bacterium]
MENVIIIGSGPAGLTAAIYLSRSGLRPLMITGEKPGGQLVNTDLIENYPGFISIKGADLMVNMLAQAENLKTKVIYESVKNVSKSDIHFEISLCSGEFLRAKSLLVATGVTHKKLCIPGEEKFTNKGVSWCATCDGPLYKGKEVAVVGGGNTAVMEALFLSKLAKKVYLIHRRSSLRAEKIMQERLQLNENIECVWNSEVVEILGEDRVNNIKIKKSNEACCMDMDVSGVFIAIGTNPSSDFLKDIVPFDNEGYILANGTKTECPGIFAAGDIVSSSLKQAIYAAGQGALAARCIEEFLSIR